MKVKTQMITKSQAYEWWREGKGKAMTAPRQWRRRFIAEASKYSHVMVE